MADTIVFFNSPAGPVGIKAVDNGDGTYKLDVKSSAVLGAGTALIGKVSIDQATANANEVVLKASSAIIGAARDAGPSWTSVHGVAGVPFTSADAQTAAAVTDAPTSGQKLVITDLLISNNSAVAIQLTFIEETSGTVITGPFALPSGTSIQLTTRSKGWKLPVADKKLMVDASAAGAIMVDAHYYSEA